MRAFVLASLLAVALVSAGVPAVSAEPLPETYFVKPLPMRMEQEGPTCVVFAGMLAMMVQDRPEAGRFPRYSWRDAWSYLKSRGEASDLYGSSVDAFLRYARDVGLKPIAQPRTRVFRVWRDGRGGYVRKWTVLPRQSAVFGGQRSRIAGYDVIFDLNREAIQRALLASGPLIVTTALDANWGVTRPDGVFKEPAGQIVGLHALVVYGWTHRDGELFWYVANSWGEMWGLKGLGLWPDHLVDGYWSYVYVIHDIDQ